MELRHLRYFVAAAATENVSRAALQLHVSQPALSRQIRDLEAELGFALLRRSAKSVRLTEAGRVFLTEARAVLQRTDEAVQTARTVATGQRGELQVGYAPSLTTWLLPATLRAFQAETPNVHVRLHDLSAEEMLAGLRAGRLQLALLVRPVAALLHDLCFTALTRDRLCLAVAPQHPLARRRTVPLTTVVGEPFLVYSRKEYPEYHKLFNTFFSASATKPRIVEEHDGVSSLISALEAGNGVALVAASIVYIAGKRLKLIPLTPASDQLVIGAAWNKTGLSPAAERFLKCVKATVALKSAARR